MNILRSFKLRSAYDFTDTALGAVVRELRDIPVAPGLIPASEDAYELLTLGKSVEQSINGDKRSYSVHLIDWQHPENNVYHVTDEFTVERRGSHATRRLDIILFVNGIPLGKLQCCRSNHAQSQAHPSAQTLDRLRHCARAMPLEGA